MAEVYQKADEQNLRDWEAYLEDWRNTMALTTLNAKSSEQLSAKEYSEKDKSTLGGMDESMSVYQTIYQSLSHQDETWPDLLAAPEGPNDTPSFEGDVNSKGSRQEESVIEISRSNTEKLSERELKVKRYLEKKLRRKWSTATKVRFPRRQKNAGIRVRKGGMFMSTKAVNELISRYGDRVIQRHLDSYCVNEEYKMLWDQTRAIFGLIRRRGMLFKISH